MPLNEANTMKSLEVLKVRYSSLSTEGLHRLQELNSLSAQLSYDLSKQSPGIFKLIDAQLGVQSISVDSIFSRMIENWDKETHMNRQQHRRQGHFDHLDIHQRGQRDQFQDHDMNRLMPKSSGNIDVLAPINRFDASTNAVCDGLKIALESVDIKHIVIPIGPGHWRGVYLTKPDDKKGQYQLELFDPYGPAGADAIRDLALGLLTQCGVKNVVVMTTGPIHKQKDGYACGDFTCAYSHLKMQQFGAAPLSYNQHLITTLEQDGNKGDVLRKAICTASDALGDQQAMQESPRAGNTPLAVIAAKEAKLGELKTIYQQIIATIINITPNYKLTVLSLIDQSSDIFQKAELINQKKEQLTDAELALKLQAEELMEAGIRPGLKPK